MTTLSREKARHFLTGHHLLRTFSRARGIAGARRLLNQLRCIQLDPLDPLGTNADLVANARVLGLKRGDIYRAILPGHGFEHFAKERCLLPKDAFPHYRLRSTETDWWRHSLRRKRVAPKIAEAVLNEFRTRGPLAPSELGSHGKVRPIDWNGWQSTSSAAKMAAELLWTDCKIVVCGRNAREKVYDIPERALPDECREIEEPFEEWALLERVRAAGLLSMKAGAHWSMLSKIRGSDLPQRLVDANRLEWVSIDGLSGKFLAPPKFLEKNFPDYDNEMRILGPLDSILWDRQLVKAVFGFEYVWEVYKPAAQRRWGWYVCPLLFRGELVGRLEGKFREGCLEISRRWLESGAQFSESAFKRMLKRHASFGRVHTIELLY